ncbi:DUF3500 domain-containing protein [Actinoplanes sp. NPDC051851]|uniref:DUF3500 domain-containing protein n=1 Tax=Actinoplanes sp. NPDC051851 TaxID=3154753 RepID=UPI00343C3BCF
MRTSIRRKVLAAVASVALGVTGATVVGTGPAAAADDTGPAIVAAANAFLATLTTAQKADVLFDWSNTTQKTRWSNLPEGLYTRDGLMWGDLTTAQQTAWLALMQVTLSTEGYNRVRAEWAADDLLSGSGYGQEYYWVALIGSPSSSTPWQWQWGGHHVTVNATVSGSELALYPSFIGAQPASYTSGSTTVKPLGDIWTDAYALLSSLTTAQKATAVAGSTYIDLLYGPGEDDRAPLYEGIPGSSLTTAQKALLFTLVSDYGDLANAEDGAARLAELEATLDQTYFVWYGPTTNVGRSYFRVTGPRVIVEYSPQALGGAPANHIHGIYRDPENDYGALITG